MKNPIDEAIQTRAGEEVETKIYQARWVWYHTILAAELAVVIVLQFLLLLK